MTPEEIALQAGHSWSSSTPILTHCIHGVDLRFTPRCYLCHPWPDDSPVFHVTGPGHVHVGEWCAKCVEHGASIDRPAGTLEAEYGWGGGPNTLVAPSEAPKGPGE